MLWVRKIIIIALSTLISYPALSQHPSREKIDSLKKLLLLKQGIKRIDNLNALSKEYWWPPLVWPDSVSLWANEANKEAIKINYPAGIATSALHLGVADIYRKNFLTAQKYLRRALLMFEDMNNDNGLAWCYLWLGQAFYAQNNFSGAIGYFTKSLSFLAKLDLREGMGKACGSIGFLYTATGNYDSGFDYLSKSLVIRQKMNDHVCVAAALTTMGHLYKVAGGYDDALDYYNQGVQYANTHSLYLHATNWNYFLDEPMAIIYQLRSMPDSSLYYLRHAIQTDPSNQLARINFGETLLLKKQYDTALKIFLEPIEHFRKENNRWDLMRVLLDAAKAFKGQKNETDALKYALEGFSIAEEANVKQYMVEGYLLLSEIYNSLQKNDSAYFFIQKYISLKDSVTNKQFLWRLTNFKKQNEFKKQLEQVSMLEKDNKIKEEKLKNASLLKWILIGGLIVIALSGFIIYRSLALKRKNEKLKNEKTQAELRHKATELEMQALRSQMNPHFIFNCLSSINRFILKNESEAASDYLTKFSRLVRMVLSNSKQAFITLGDELEMLRLYLDLERLRFKNSFDYRITFANSIDVTSVFIPPLILQPFAENAIWHGLMHKQERGELILELMTDNKMLTCIISDNGVGRAKATALKSKSAENKKSLGLNITAERLNLLNKDMNHGTHFYFEDLTDDDGKAAGTKVILKMPCRDAVENTT